VTLTDAQRGCLERLNDGERLVMTIGCPIRVRYEGRDGRPLEDYPGDEILGIGELVWRNLIAPQGTGQVHVFRITDAGRALLGVPA
jgi:hypothetical protein